ncbi:MAG: polysaccharide deacetylase family protein [Bryobacterales bacterium]|nr:polysaccharide deacetylase family protein [Bryobacterales bacterium]
MSGVKREMLARGLWWSGAAPVISRLPGTESLLILNYHRIGNAQEDQYDPGVFSGTAEQLDAQVAFLKRCVRVVTLEEAVAWTQGKADARGGPCRALITFDDGYLDNYQLAFPVLRSHGVQGLFFLCSGIVGSGHVPFWDYTAFVVKSARRRRFQLRYPVAQDVDIDATGLTLALRQVLNLYKRPDNTDGARFLAELAEACQGDTPGGAERRFLNWEEAREMLAGGMALGSHTHSHPVLSQLGVDAQREELVRSRAVLEKNLGATIDTLAYPVGGQTSFTEDTQRLAAEAGYRAAFSYYGGTNRPGRVTPFNLKRVGVGEQSFDRFRVAVSMHRWRASFWP